MSKEEIVKAIRACARKLKRKPTRRDLRAAAGISWDMLNKHFGGLKEALESAGIEATGSGFRQKEATLLLDWAKVARELGKIPAVNDYRSCGHFSDGPFYGRYGKWTQVSHAFKRFVKGAKIEREWKDVLGMIGHSSGKENLPKTQKPHLRLRKNGGFQDRPFYGPLLNLPELIHEPLTEQGVIFAFGMVARKLGFGVLRFQQAFPDCEALREVVRGQLQRVRIEFEYESRNFLRHRHNPNGCDAIVCWKHNWKECPKHIEVIELRKVMKELIG